VNADKDDDPDRADPRQHTGDRREAADLALPAFQTTAAVIATWRPGRPARDPITFSD
jgi:hypothetical protein